MYWSHILSHQDPVVVQVSYFAGTLSVLCMSFALLISARPKSVETAFGGLDRMYRLHKYLGIAALLLFLLHFATAVGEDDEFDAVASAETAAAA